MTEQEQILELRMALKSALDRLEREAKQMRAGGQNSQPRDRVIAQAYAALRISDPDLKKRLAEEDFRYWNSTDTTVAWKPQ